MTQSISSLVCCHVKKKKVTYRSAVFVSAVTVKYSNKGRKKNLGNKEFSIQSGH